KHLRKVTPGNRTTAPRESSHRAAQAEMHACQCSGFLLMAALRTSTKHCPAAITRIGVVAEFSYSKRKSHYDSTVCGSGSSGPVVARRLYGNVSMKEQAMNSRTH